MISQQMRIKIQELIETFDTSNILYYTNNANIQFDGLDLFIRHFDNTAQYSCLFRTKHDKSIFDYPILIKK